MMYDEEIEEYEEDFIEAWRGYFGKPMFYIPLDRDKTKINDLYGESAKKVYDFENKKQFHGIFRQKPYAERGELYGRENYDTAEISFIAKELRDLGVEKIDQSAIIEIFERDGTRKLYNIIGDYGKVHLRDRKLTTRLIVSEVTETSRTNAEELLEEVPEEEPPKNGGLTYL